MMAACLPLAFEFSDAKSRLTEHTCWDQLVMPALDGKQLKGEMDVSHLLPLAWALPNNCEKIRTGVTLIP